MLLILEIFPHSIARSVQHDSFEYLSFSHIFSLAGKCQWKHTLRERERAMQSDCGFLNCLLVYDHFTGLPPLCCACCSQAPFRIFILQCWYWLQRAEFCICINSILVLGAGELTHSLAGKLYTIGFPSLSFAISMRKLAVCWLLISGKVACDFDKCCL